MNLAFRGVGVAIVTPFTNQNKVDYNALEKLVNHLISGGVQYLVVQGTTGETPTLTPTEKKEVLEAVISFNKNKLPIVLGHGGNNTQELVNELKTINFNGVSAILSASPYYNKPTQAGIYQHYKMLAQTSPVPIILYNVPGRTASNVLPETQLKLATDYKNIIAVKEASGNLTQKSQIIKNKPENFLVISGDDDQVLTELALGNDGVISVIANAFPRLFTQMVKLGFQDKFTEARIIHYQVIELINLLFADGNPGGIKAALNILGICNDVVRLPLVNINSQVYNAIEKQVEILKKLELEV